jgi:hypothetical protein
MFTRARARGAQRGICGAKNVTAWRKGGKYLSRLKGGSSQQSPGRAHAKWTGINRLTKCRSVFVIAALAISLARSLTHTNTQHSQHADEREVHNNIHRFFECRLRQIRIIGMCVCVRMDAGNLSIAAHTRARVLIPPAESAGGSCVCGLISCAKWICSLAPLTRIQSCSVVRLPAFFSAVAVRVPHFSSRDPVWIFSLHIWIARKYFARLI